MNANIDAMQLEPVEPVTVTEIVATRLMGLLSEGILRPGDKLPPERDLAKQLHVGRTTVREALKLLTLSGILEAKRGDGTYVCHDFSDFLSQQIRWPVLLSNRGVNIIAEVRAGLEVQTARLAAMRATPEDLERIAVFRRLGELEGRDIELETDIDLQFHTAIAQAAHNDLLYHLMLSMHGVLRQYIALSNEMTDQVKTTVAESQAIYDAIVARDADAAAHAMCHHLCCSKEWILKASLDQGDTPQKDVGAAVTHAQSRPAV